MAKEKGGEVPEGEMTQEAHSRMYREGEEKRDHPHRNSRKKDVGSKNDTRQKSHRARCASDNQQDPNNDSPCAHHCSQGKHTQPTEQLVWCVLAGQVGHSTHIQTYEELSSQERDSETLHRNTTLQSSRWLYVDEIGGCRNSLSP